MTEKPSPTKTTSPSSSGLDTESNARQLNQKLLDLLLQTFKSESDCLKSEIKELRNREVSNMQELFKLRMEKLEDQFRLQLEERNVRGDRLRSELERVSEELEERDARDKTLHSELERVSKELEEKDAREIKLQLELERMSKELEDKDASGDRLRSELEHESKELEEKTRLLRKTEENHGLVEARLRTSISDVRRLEVEIRRMGDQLGEAEMRCRNTQKEVEDLKQRLGVSESRSKVLELEIERRKEEENARREAKEREDARRREVEEARRRMEDMIRAEKERKRVAEQEEMVRVHSEKERQRQMEEELGARKKAEQERLEREHQRKIEGGARRAREEAERARKERGRKQMAWKAATEAEINRCRERDSRLCGLLSTFKLVEIRLWTASDALRRFELMLKDFESIKFAVEQNLTFENIPWPSLAHPYAIRFEDVNWFTVEMFFDGLQMVMEFDQYKALLKVHLTFHPDRWWSRNLMGTVMDEKLREALEDAGNTVSQAITPLWKKSKA